MTNPQNNAIIEIYKIRIDLIHKKLLVWIALGAGSGAYGIEFLKEDNLFFGFLFILFLIISVIAIAINYKKLNEMDYKLNSLEKENNESK